MHFSIFAVVVVVFCIYYFIYLPQFDILRFLKCSGYHIRLTRGRSQVRALPGTKLLFYIVSNSVKKIKISSDFYFHKNLSLFRGH